MSTDLVTRISELAVNVDKLGHKSTGMPITANDWNALVDALLGILRVDRDQEDGAQAALEDRFARKDHDHINSVSFEWLNDDLRARVGAAGGVVAVRDLVSSLDQKVTALGTEVTRLRAASDQLQRSIDDFAVHDVDRAKKVSTLEGRITQLSEVSVQVSALSGDMAGVKTNIDTVLQLRDSLRDAAGQPINFVQMRTDVRDLQSLRDSLVSADGHPLRLRDLDLKVRELQDAVGTGTGLETRFTNLSSAIETKLTAAVSAQITTVRADLATQQETAINNTVKTRVDAAAAAQDQVMQTRIAEAEQRLAASVPAKVLTQVQQQQEPRFAAFDLKLADIDPHINAAVAAAKNDIQTSVTTSLTTRFANDLQQSVGTAEARIIERVKGTENAFTDLKKSLPDAITASVDAHTTELHDALVDEVRKEVGTAKQAIEASIPTAAANAAVAALSNLDARIGTTVTAQIGDLGARVNKEVETATKNLSTDIDTAVNAELTALDLPGQINRATTQSAQQIRAEVAKTISDERARTTNDINAATLGLRSEIASAVAIGRNDVLNTARSLVDGLRTDTDTKLTAINKRFDTIRVTPHPGGVVTPGITPNG